MALLAGKALKPWLCEVTEAEDQRWEKLMQVPLFKGRLASAKIRLKVEPQGLRSGLCTKPFPCSYQLSAPDREVRNDEKRTNFDRRPTPSGRDCRNHPVLFSLPDEEGPRKYSCEPDQYRAPRNWCSPPGSLKVWATGPLTDDALTFSKHFLIDFLKGGVIFCKKLRCGWFTKLC